jgi:hypothetical protein
MAAGESCSVHVDPEFLAGLLSSWGFRSEAGLVVVE